jgi:hypothetical protein
MRFETRDDYLRWLRDEWAGDKWEHLPGYSPAKVGTLAQEYAKFEKPEKSCLKESFGTYHTEVLEPWVGSKFFSGARPRIGLYLREYPLPCLDRTSGLLPGHAGLERLPATVMDESVRAVLDGNLAYRTIDRALVCCLAIVETTFGVSFAKNLHDFVEHVVFADWVRPFAMFKNHHGAAFDGKLSKRSWHRREMYEFAGPLFATEVGSERLDLDIIIVMGLDMFQHGFAHLGKYAVWPPLSGPKFHTLRGPPDQGWKSSRPRLLVLPHPAAREFDDALERLGVDVESDAKERQSALLDDLSSRLREIIPTEVITLRKRFRRFSPHGRPSIYLHLQKSRIIFKTTLTRHDTVQWVENWVKQQKPFEWRRPEKNNNICIGIPNSVSVEAVDALFNCLESVL